MRLNMRSTALGTIAIVVGTLTPSPAFSKSPQAPPKGCSGVISACQSLVDAQDASIQSLKTYTKQLEDKLNMETHPLFPTWMLIAGGIVVGGIVGFSLRR